MRSARQAPSLPLLLALATLLLHLVLGNGYGYFRDELYYMVAGERLAFGYADYPPFIALVAALSRALLGDSLLAIRLLPALAGSATVYLTAWMARELGGGRFAQALAGLVLLTAPLFRITANMLSPIPFDLLWWAAAFALLVRLLHRDEPRLFLWLGVVAGLGLVTKYNMLLFGLGLVLALAATPERRFLRTRPLWLGGGIALAILLPNLLWQYQHDWPSVGYVLGLGRVLLAETPLAQFLNELVLGLNPLSWPILAAGLYFTLRTEEGRRYRVVGWLCLSLYLVLLVLRGKSYYFAPLHPPLLAVGAMVVERKLRRTAQRAALAVVVCAGLVMLPMALPILPLRAFLVYSALLGQTVHGSFTGETQRLPSHFADMHGWPELVDAVARVYDGLAPEEHARAAIYARYFGEAAAIDILGDARGLPSSISADFNYFYWGPGEPVPDLLVVVGLPAERLERMCGAHEVVAVHTHPYALAPEQTVPISICRALVRPLGEMWPELRSGF